MARLNPTSSAAGVSPHTAQWLRHGATIAVLMAALQVPAVDIDRGRPLAIGSPGSSLGVSESERGGPLTISEGTRDPHATERDPPADRAVPLTLKLEAGELDVTFSNVVSDAQRQILKAYQRALDSDDSREKALSLERRMRALDTELREARTVAMSSISVTATQETAATIEAVPWSGNGRDHHSRWNSSLIAAAIALGALVLAAGHYRWRSRRESRALPGQESTPLAREPPLNLQTEKHQQVRIDSGFNAAVAVADPIDAILSDADLFAMLGKPSSAISLLRHELIAAPDNRRLREKLVEILSAQADSRELEQSIEDYAARFGVDAASTLRGKLAQGGAAKMATGRQ